jgi:hypothetical protein
VDSIEIERRNGSEIKYWVKSTWDMTTDSAAAIEPNPSATADRAYVSPAVDFMVVLAGMSALAIGVAVIILP